MMKQKITTLSDLYKYFNCLCDSYEKIKKGWTAEYSDFFDYGILLIDEHEKKKQL